MRRFVVLMALAALAVEFSSSADAGHRRCGFRRARCCSTWGYGNASFNNFSGACCTGQVAYGQFGTQPADSGMGTYHGQQNTVGYPPSEVAPAPAVESSTTIHPQGTFRNDGSPNRAPVENRVDRQVDRAEDKADRKIDRVEDKADREVDRAQDKSDRNE